MMKSVKIGGYLDAAQFKMSLFLKPCGSLRADGDGIVVQRRIDNSDSNDFEQFCISLLTIAHFKRSLYERDREQHRCMAINIHI